MKTWLLDTGPIVAYLDANDPAHDLVGRAIDAFSGEFVTTSAVVTEAMHFVSAIQGGSDSLVEFLDASRAQIAECCQPEDLKQAARLMKKYADTPMDFADATLVLLGDALRHNHICTLDRRGFSTFRTSTGKRFSLVLEDFET